MSDNTELLKRLKEDRPWAYDDSGQQFEYVTPEVADAAAAALSKQQEEMDEVYQRAAECVPENWCDELLTGPNGLGAEPWRCPEIDRLLRGVKERIEALAKDPPHAPD